MLTQTYPVTVYRSTDDNAPILDRSPNCVAIILKACLVTGYGDKEPAGWTMPFEDNDKGVKVLRAKVGAEQDFYLRVSKDTGREITIQVYSQMTDVDGGELKLECDTPFRYNGGNVSGAWVVVACGRGVWFCNEFKSQQGCYMYCGDTTADSKGGRGVCLAHSGGDKNGIYNSSERQAIIPYDASIDTRIYTPPVFWHVLSDTKSKVVFESLFDGVSDKTDSTLISPIHFFAGRQLYMINAYMPSKNVLNNYDTVATADMTFINHATGTYLSYGRQMASNMYVRTDGWEF